MADLILLNGPPGIGKSTLATMFADRHPRTLNLDIDQVRCLIGGWQENFRTAGELVRPIAFSMAVTHLASGHDVIMPQFLDGNDEVASFRAAAEETSSGFREIVIMDTKENCVARFGDRGADQEVAWHGQVKAIVDRNGGAQLLESMYDDLANGLRKRPNATLIRSNRGAVEETYAKLIYALGALPNSLPETQDDLYGAGSSYPIMP